MTKCFSMKELFPFSPNRQATNQILAVIVTLAFAVVGGLVTGFIMHFVGKSSNIDDEDLYDDNFNIDDMEEKHEVPEEIVCLIEKSASIDHETSKLLSRD